MKPNMQRHPKNIEKQLNTNPQLELIDSFHFILSILYLISILLFIAFDSMQQAMMGLIPNPLLWIRKISLQRLCPVSSRAQKNRWADFVG